MNGRCILCLAWPAIVACGFAARGDDRTVLVFAAASTSNALDEIRAEFSKTAGVRVEASYAASSTLARQIAYGADADLFLSADTAWADHVAGKGLVAARKDLLGNRLVVVAPVDSPLKLAKAEDLLAPAVEHLALGDPEAVPAGKYAKAALTKLELWSRLKEKVVPAADVRHALGYVETGAAEAAVVYATDAAVSKRVRVAFELPATLTPPIRYPLLLLKHGQGRTAAESFYRYLSSPAALKVFQKFGFQILTEPAGKK
jgi:molybdate transport system substrate-binding protein